MRQTSQFRRIVFLSVLSYVLISVGVRIMRLDDLCAIESVHEN